MIRLGPYELNTIVTGDARELAEAIPAESVDLLICDPIYWQVDDYRWLGQIGYRLLKTNGNLIMQAAHYYVPRIFQALQDTELMFCWLICERYGYGTRALNALKIAVGWKPWIWYSKGNRGGGWVVDSIFNSMKNKSFHDWGDNPVVSLELITRLTTPGAIIFDPFTGGGTVPAVCKMLGRNYLAFEIDPATADKARQRVLMTQPPLFVAQPEQVPLFVEAV